MPNVKGLDSAPHLLTSLPTNGTYPYGPHATVERMGLLIVLRNNAQIVLATVDMSVDKAKVKADLRAIDGNTVTAVNALLRPYGKVKAYWRAKPGDVPYRWHPVDGKASAPIRGTASPKVPLSVPVVASTGTAGDTHLAPTAVVEARPTAEMVVTEEVKSPGITIKVTAGAGHGVTIPTERRASGKAPTVKQVTKTFTQMGEVLLPHTDYETLEIAWRLRAAGRPAGVRITGPAGTAKTLMAQEFAFSKGVPFLIVEGQSIQTAADWYGKYVPNASGVGFEWVWSDFALALRRGEPMVVLVDELNRPENERALNGLMGLMAWTAETHPADAPESIKMPPGILIMATVNEGVEFVATVEIDAAINSRFPWGVRMAYVPKSVEARVLRQQAPGLDQETANRLVAVAAMQRAKRDDDTLYPSHNVISTRDLIEVANAITQAGATPSAALWANARSRFIPEDDAALGVLIEAQFGANPEPSSALADDDDIEQMLSAE